MPIKPENKDRYPENWPAIREQILLRADHRCECRGECGAFHMFGRCIEVDKQDARNFRGKVALTVAHLDHCPENCAIDNLRAWCQKCHNKYDSAHRAETRRDSKDKKSGQTKMPW